MAQPSVAHYFASRKRPAVDDYRKESAAKLLKLDNFPGKTYSITGKASENEINTECLKRHVKAQCTNLLKSGDETQKKEVKANEVIKQAKPVTSELGDIKKKLLNSAKLDKLKASLSKFKETEKRLEAAEKRTDALRVPKLRNFKSLEFDIPVSPEKLKSPEKPYLSPKKELSVKRNLLGALSPTKRVLDIESQSRDGLDGTSKPSLKLPYKYRTLAEIFRAMDTVSQIMYTRKEQITFKKLKPAIEEMLKRTFLLKHVAQIKYIYPDSFAFTREKVRQFGLGTKQESWELVVAPTLKTDEMTSSVLLERRRKLYEALLSLTTKYHNEFLLSLNPPIKLDTDKITHWHPEFDIEKVPDVQAAQLPESPSEDKTATGKEVLEKARILFNCNTRVARALEKLHESRAHVPVKTTVAVEGESLMKGIPKALIDKVREKQAAKAFLSMTRSTSKEMEIQLYSRLPEIARLTRNLFVTEKKGVLPLETVVEKLSNSYRSFLTKPDLETHLKTLSQEVPDWLIFHKIRGVVFLKLAKNADMSAVLSKLQALIKQKSES